MSTTDSIQDLLSFFDRLTRSEQAVVAREIARRFGDARLSGGDTAFEEELTYLSDQLFAMYEREEEVNDSAKHSTR